MADDQTSPNQAAVGYGRPPVATRFRKGQSGNPAGRPPGSRKRWLSPLLKALMREEALRPIPVEIRGERITLPVAQAAIHPMESDADE